MCNKLTPEQKEYIARRAEEFRDRAIEELKRESPLRKAIRALK